MTRPMGGLSLGAKLLLMVAAALAPAFVVIFYHANAQKQSALADAYAELSAVADLSAAVQRRTAEGTRQLLVAMARAPEVRAMGEEGCARYLADLKKQFERYANFGVIDERGLLRCSALPLSRQILLEDREYFRGAVESGGFTVGRYQVGRATGTASVNFSLPIVDSKGESTGVVFAALDLNALDRISHQARLSEGTELTVTDAAGVILLAFPSRPGALGTRLPDAVGVAAIPQASKGVERITDVNGVEHIRAQVRIGGFAAGELAIEVRRPLEPLLGPIERRLAWVLAALAVVAVAMGLIAWLVGARSIKRPLRQLTELTRRVAAGDLSVRSGLRSPGDEVGILGEAIDEMIAKLEAQRDAQARQRLDLVAGEARLAQAQRIARLGSWEFDIPANRLEWSDETFRIFGLDRAAFAATYEAFLASVHPEDRASMWEAQVAALEGRAPLDHEHRIVTPDGAVKVVHERGELRRDAQGRPLRLSGTVLDITERKRAERERERLAAIVDSSNDAIWSRDLDDTVLTWNAGAERLFGWRREEVIGRNDAFLLPPERRAERQAMVERLALDKGRLTLETMRLAKDGAEVEVEARVSAILDPSGRLAGHSVVMHDITERKRTARELAEASARLRYLSGRLLDAQEEERKAIAMELHDEIGQALSAIKLDLGFVSRLVSDPAAREKLERTARITDTVLGQVRNLSLDLRPPQLDLMGLEPALRAALEQSAAAAGIALGVEASLAPGPRDAQAEIACFRVAQEAMTNVIRHARAREVRVTLVQDDGTIRLRFRDDGVGFSLAEATASANQGRSMGIQGMRERTILAGGAFEIDTSPGEGTTIVASFPHGRPPSAEREGT